MKTIPPGKPFGYTRSQLTGAAVVGGAWIVFYILMLAWGGRTGQPAMEVAAASGGKISHSAIIFQTRSDHTRGANASSKP